MDNAGIKIHSKSTERGQMPFVFLEVGWDKGLQFFTVAEVYVGWLHLNVRYKGNKAGFVQKYIFFS